MKNLVLASFFDDLGKTLEQHPYLIYVLMVCCAILVVLVVIAFVLSVKKREYKTQENVAETVSESDSVDEKITEEPVEEVIENQPEVVEEPKVEETPVVEEIIEESPAGEEQKQEEESVVEELTEEVPTVEEPKVEEAPVNEKPQAKKVSAKKPTQKKKVEEQVMTKEKETTKTPRVVNGKYEVFTDGTAFFYTLKASNGEVLIKSEAYATKESVLSAIVAIKRNISAGSIIVREDKHGLFQFALVAKNHRTLVMSANYSTEARAKSASQSFVRFAETSPVYEIAEKVESSKEIIDTTSATDKKGGKIGVVAEDEGYYYILKASNGEVLVHSTIYKSEASAQAALERFKETVKTGKFYVEKDKRDNYQFKLFSSAGRIICVGQIYSSKSVAISAAISVCSFINLATPIQE